MITTSNFAVAKNDPRAVAISQGVPWWYKGRRMIELAPSRDLLNYVKASGDTKRFDEAMREQLDKLDAKKIIKELGPDAILLCWEGFNTRCHRRLVAEYFEQKWGIEVPELNHTRAESIPYIEQVGKGKRPVLRSQLLMF